MTDDFAKLEVALARVEGKIDTLTIRIDSGGDALRAAIQAGDNENRQALKFLEDTAVRAHKRLDEETGTRGKAVDGIVDRLDRLERWQSNITGRMVILAALSSIIIAVITALILKAMNT